MSSYKAIWKRWITQQKIGKGHEQTIQRNGNIDVFIYFNIDAFKIQLNLEQHGFEQHSSKYRQIFFNKYDGKSFEDL